LNGWSLLRREGGTQMLRPLSRGLIRPESRGRASSSFYASASLLDVVVERELVRVRAQPDRIDLVLPLVLDPRLDEVGREHLALQQELVVLFEVVEHDVERAGKLLDLLLLRRGQLVEVLVDGLARIDLVRDAVQAGHHTRGERQIRIASRIGRAEL